MSFPFTFPESFGDDDEELAQLKPVDVDVLSPEIEFPDEALGIHQSDVIIRMALVNGIKELRKNPKLLDYVFLSLPRDTLTAKDYGQKSLDKAKEWFLKTEIPVAMVPRIDEGKWPLITISLSDSQEFENTLGDVHYRPIELVTKDLNNEWPALTPKFNVTSYDQVTGAFTLPESITDNLIVVPGMYIIDDAGAAHLILSQGESYWCITANTKGSFKKAVIKGVRPNTVVHMESATFKETYTIGVHVGGEPVYLTWLHSIIVFILLRYRESLLEARGFERSSFGSSDFTKNEQIDAELVFSRYVSLNGVVRHYWPKHIVPALNGVVLDLDGSEVGSNQIVELGLDIDLDKDGIG